MCSGGGGVRKDFRRSFTWVVQSISVRDRGCVEERNSHGSKREIGTTLFVPFVAVPRSDRDGPMVRSSTTSCTVTHHQPLENKTLSYYKARVCVVLLLYRGKKVEYPWGARLQERLKRKPLTFVQPVKE